MCVFLVDLSFRPEETGRLSKRPVWKRWDQLWIDDASKAGAGTGDTHRRPGPHG